MGVAGGVGGFQVQPSLGLQGVEVPQVDVVPLLVPLGANPVEERPRPLGRRLVHVVSHLGGARPDQEPHIRELAHLLLQGGVLQAVVLDPLLAGGDVGLAGVVLDVRNRKAVLQDDDLVFLRQDLQRRFLLVRFRARVTDPDVPVVVRVVLPAVGRLLREGLLGDAVLSLVGRVVGSQPGGHAAVPDAFARRVMQEDDPGIGTKRLRLRPLCPLGDGCDQKKDHRQPTTVTRPYR